MDPIYIVDDEPAICTTLGGILQDEGYDVVACPDAETLFSGIPERKPSLVLLDIWLPGADGMEVLQTFKAEHPDIPVIMISGHAGIESAVNSIKLGAFDFLEKPLQLDALLEKVTSALSQATDVDTDKYISSEMPSNQPSFKDSIYKESLSLVESDQPQKTLEKNVVLNGMGLFSGRNTGIILSPLGPNKGIIFQSLDGQIIPGHITSLENYNQASAQQKFMSHSTVLVNNNRIVRTIEHLMAVLSMLGITNLLIKMDEEIPNIDSSGERFCRLIHEAGIVEQPVKAKKVVIHEKILVGEEDINERYLYVEPFDGLEIKMRVNFPAPILEQEFTFNPEQQAFETEIAPARTFNFFENINTAQKLGKAGNGTFDSHIIIHDDKVINTDLRFPDEFVRHKILDMIGDLYLIGFPIQGRFVGNMSSHSINHAIVTKMHMTLSDS